MADPTGADPGGRGSLHVAGRVAERISERAALETRGVVPLKQGLGPVQTRYPNASARIGGARSHVDVEIAVAWAAPLDEVTARVRDGVADALSRLLGHQGARVDVRATVVSTTGPDHERRVR